MTTPNPAHTKQRHIMDTNLVIALYGGPKHGQRFTLPNANVRHLQHKDGHYTRVPGGRPDEFYWREFSNPMAASQGDELVPVEFKLASTS